jgi:DNA repair protein RadC
MGEDKPGYRIRDIAASERPRERMAALGARALSNAELIAILLRTGIEGMNAVELATHLLTQLGGLPGLHKAPLEMLNAMRGIGPAKATQLKAAVELGRRFAAASPEEMLTIRSPQDAAMQLMYEMGAFEQEHLRVLILDTRNQLLKIKEVYLGSLNTSLIRVGEVYREAIRCNAAAIIVAHNHPSGDPTPSPEDINVTRALAKGGELLDIELLDHLIIGKNRFISLKEKGLGFE